MKITLLLFGIFGFSALAAPEDDKVSELEVLRYENAQLKLQQVVALCESTPEYKNALAAFNNEAAKIVKAHKLDVQAGDQFDLKTREIKRAKSKK